MGLEEFGLVRREAEHFEFSILDQWRLYISKPLEARLVRAALNKQNLKNQLLRLTQRDSWGRSCHKTNPVLKWIPIQNQETATQTKILTFKIRGLFFMNNLNMRKPSYTIQCTLTTHCNEVQRRQLGPARSSYGQWPWTKPHLLLLYLISDSPQQMSFLLNQFRVLKYWPSA